MKANRPILPAEDGVLEEAAVVVAGLAEAGVAGVALVVETAEAEVAEAAVLPLLLLFGEAGRLVSGEGLLFWPIPEGRLSKYNGSQISYSNYCIH
ncbi:hypothetical protein LSTR_LSTR015797 [Laodelphax striatellus]|uniref:Uncharacterized protein n=1 Tax=Laodelphax striatellus TaxID=195883 RepID=A0A482WPZ3_LAOST|nr:hypothetical protein LSTR_LSTR015797 [Laodelphax striatellus]